MNETLLISCEHIKDSNESSCDLKEQVLQAVRAQVILFRGNLLLSRKQGLHLNTATILVFFREKILEVPGVNSVAEINVKHDSATCTIIVSFTAELVDGTALEHNEALILL